MKTGIIFLLSVLSALFVPVAYGGNDAAAIATAQAAAPHRGTLYRARHGRSTVYLFGTIHVGLPSFFPLEPQVTHALAEARTLVVEIDIRNNTRLQAALQKHGLYAKGDSLDRHLSQPDMARLRRALQRFDIPLEQAVRMKPWLVANLLTGQSLEQHGYQRSEGIESFLLKLADKQKMAVQELESADYQMALFDSMPASEQVQYLLENLDDLDDDSRSRDAALIDAWEHAKSDTFEQLMRESLAGKPAAAEFTRRVLLGQRNPIMTNKIEPLLHRDGTSFVAIGSLHLVGKGGVPALLRQRGYQVEKLY